MEPTLGNIFIALVDEADVFDPVLHARNDFDLVDARPRWTETDFWSIECEVVTTPGGVFSPGGRRKVFISEMVAGVVQLSFIGRIEGWPIGPAGRTVTLTVMCKPALTYTEQGQVASSAEQIEIAALAGINDDPWWLFSDPTDKRTADLVLASRSALLHWGRSDLPPVLVDLIEGSGFIDIGSGFVEGSLEFEQPAQPISRVDVTIKAEWQQSFPVVANLANALGNEGYFGTISSPDWGDFPKVGESIGDWTVIQSSVEPRSPPAGVNELSRVFTGVAGGNRSLDAAKARTPTQLRFRRMFFDVDLLATTVLTANRRESVTFSLVWEGQEIAGYQGTTETVELECRNLRRDLVSGTPPAWVAGVAVGAGQRCEFDGAIWVCTAAHITGASLYSDFGKWAPLLLDYSPSGGPAMGIFFGATQQLTVTTPQGNIQTVTRSPTPGVRAIRYGMLQARAKLISGVRIIRASFDVPWEDVRTITGRERMRIADDSIPGGSMVGKVVAIEADLVRGVARITIAAAPGTQRLEPAIFPPSYAVRPLTTMGIVAASVDKPYNVQEQLLTQYELPAQYDLARMAEQMQTSFTLEMAPTSGTPDFEVTRHLGEYPFSTDRMVDLNP
ncbi:hypothetical protein [Sphingomonas yantingensis]|uniref:Uncharacterized protein n=1 Tax=Sphingomonas yantingensis TaxID=1241761 RepID=A0A7W9AT14_9SPHN|nr:hypothetical protein [Sphingomonas yantingensis]MBB5700016.1 hypothetical protein [Sphingomonas yantingensis]